MKFPVLAAGSLAVFFAFGAAMVRVSAPTFDEPVHLASGYTSLLQSRRILNGMDHPPLAEMWAALPLLALRPVVFFSRPEWLNGRLYNYADLFLYKNRVDAGRLLDWARLWSLLSCALLLGLPILLWSRRLAGEEGVVAASLLFAFCPPLFSNAALVANDAVSTGLFFLTFWLLSQEKRGLRLWAAAGAVTGLALAAKFNMVILPALAASVVLGDLRLERKKLPLAHCATAALMAFFTLAVVYRFKNLGLYWDGLTATLSRLGEGRGAFLMGQHSVTGWLSYFPVALLLKTPLTLLAAAAVGLAACGTWPRREVRWLLAAPAAYFAAACLSKTQIGYRHILPVYPFLIVWAAGGAAWLWKKGIKGQLSCAALAVWLTVSVLAAAPHSLAYFNELAGGPAGGYRYLVDSNLDWGQGLKPLAEDLKGRGNPPIFLSYFGVADPSYYGIRYAPLAFFSTVERREGVELPGKGDKLFLAVSATNLQTVYFADHELFDWLKAKKPVSKPGHSVFLYDLTDDRQGAEGLASLAQRAGNPGAAQRILVEYVHGGGNGTTR